MKTAIIYYSKTGHTLEAAEAVASGMQQTNNPVDIIPCRAVSGKDLSPYDILLFGSPCWMAGQSQTGISWPIKNLLTKLDPEMVQGKICGGFSVHGGRGADRTIKMMGKILIAKGCKQYIEGPYASAGAPLSLWQGPSVKEWDIDRFIEFGKRIFSAPPLN